MTPRMWINLVALVVALLAIAALVWGYKEFQAMQAKVEAMESVSTVTSGATDALSESSAATQEVVVTVRQERARSDQAFEELKQHDQTVNDWANQPLPASLRDIDRRPVNGLEDSPSGRGIADPEN